MVDDHSIVRAGLKNLLADEFANATFGEAANADEALAQVHRQAWDVTVLDIGLPGRSGLDVLGQIVNSQPNMAVLVLSVHPEGQFAVRALKLGAAGYLNKAVAPDELIGVVKKVLSGAKHVSSAQAQTLAGSLEPLSHECLSRREHEVMCLIAQGKSVTQIAGDLCLSVKTISTFRTRIMNKMKFKTSADLIRYALHNKLVD